MAAMANGTQISTSFLLPPPSQLSFSPQYTAMTANILWFISLGLSLACAVSATLVQQWARNYIHAIERRPSAERRARMRMFLFEGVGKFKMSSLIDAVPALLHLALFTFLLGLIFFIRAINTAVSAVAGAIFSLCVAAYLFATFLPLVAFDCPIQTPLTSLVWHKAVIRTVHWTGFRLGLLRDMVVLALKDLFHPIPMIWSAVDLFARTILIPVISSFFRSTVQLLVYPARAVWTAVDLLARTASPDPPVSSSSVARRGKHSQFKALISEHETRIAAHWSKYKVDVKDPDSFRSSLARDQQIAGFEEREHRALVWLVECLDDDRELLPLIEAVPAFIKSAQASNAAEPRKTLSSVLRHPELSIPARLHDLLDRHYTKPRVVSSYVEFLLCTQQQDWTFIFESDLARLSDITFPSNHPMWNGLHPDFRLKVRCLEVQTYSCWLSVHPDPNQIRETKPFEIGPQWSPHFVDLWNKLLDELHILPGDQHIASHLQKLPYIALGRLFLNTLPDISNHNFTLLFDTVDTIWGQLIQGAIPNNRFYCAAMELVVRAFASMPDILSDRVCQRMVPMFRPLVDMTHPYALKVLDRMLQSSLWMQNSVLEECFVRLVENNVGRLDESGMAALSYSVITKHQILAIHRLQPESTLMWTVRSLYLRKLDGEEQQLVVKKINSLVTRHPLIPVPEFPELAELNFLYFFCDALIPLLYIFDDVKALRDAFLFIDRVLQPNRSIIIQHPYLQRLLECRTFLARKTQCEIGVQVLIRLEQGVQVGEPVVEVEEKEKVDVAVGS